MVSLLLDWLGLLVRWTHVMLGIGWIGTSFFFIWLDASLRRAPGSPEGIAGDSWMVHGGGFYLAQKYLVAPAALPKDLHWFKYEAYLTWVSGFLLLCLVYYAGAQSYLVDPEVLPLPSWAAILISLGGLAGGWILYDLICRSPIGRSTLPLAVAVFLLATAAAILFTHVFSGRAAFLHVGAFLGTIMAANVFMIIIPNQKKVVADLLAGRKPDPALGKQAKQRSLHNNYLTLPVVLMMISNHYPMLTESPYSWAFVVGFFLLSGLLRLYANETHAGKPAAKLTWAVAAAGAVGLVLVLANIGLLSAPATTAAVAPAAVPATATTQAAAPAATAAGATTTTAAATAPAAAPAAPAGPRVEIAQIVPVIQARCVECHSANPTDPGFRKAPKGIVFDRPEDIERQAELIRKVAVQTHLMPLGNKTKMTAEERDLLARWLAGRGQN
jgi:uncharacterized membrane protein